jgi:hypothetical protein
MKKKAETKNFSQQALKSSSQKKIAKINENIEIDNIEDESESFEKNVNYYFNIINFFLVSSSYKFN